MAEWRVAIVVDPAQPLGFLANTVAVLAAGVGTAMPALGGRTLTDSAGRAFLNSADRPIPVLQGSAETLSGLLCKSSAPPEGAIIVPFPLFARSIHAFEAYAAEFAARDLSAEALLGIAIAGPDRWVRSLTGSLKLLR
jgi:hypothetical protein